MKNIYDIYNFVEMLFCEFSCTVGQKQIIFTKYFVRTGNPRYLGEKQNTILFTKLTKHGRGKLHSIEPEIDAQACNVS